MSLNYVFYRSHDRSFLPVRWLNKTIHLSVAARAPSLTLYNQLWLSSGRLTDGTSYLFAIQAFGTKTGKWLLLRQRLVSTPHVALLPLSIIHNHFNYESHHHEFSPVSLQEPCGSASVTRLQPSERRSAFFLFFWGEEGCRLFLSSSDNFDFSWGLKKILTVNQNSEQAFERRAREANLSLSEPFPLCLPLCVFVSFALHLVLIVLSFSPSFFSYLHSSIHSTTPSFFPALRYIFSEDYWGQRKEWCGAPM